MYTVNPQETGGPTAVTPKRTSAEAAETRARLVEVGRELFGSGGFTATRATDIARRAGVTRGALLHHFVDKEGLFAAVLESVEEEVAARLMTAALAGSDPLEWLQLGFDAFLTECLDPAITQIMLIDGPSVLGWEAWHEIDSRYGYQPVLDTVSAAVAAGLLESDDPESLASLLLGALSEAGTVISRSDSPEETRARMAASLGRLIERLRPGGPPIGRSKPNL
jgi:AcrR family transcriptional regulator